ncbi:Cache 3/Cache 2 fusion domain-containing protein [Azovibrio restrictus]|uniref:Cache 3/Cache 2 fusion domain-containing protein n=1 Tax=Azovibrio restrictus TaxID=146938 RepID=UPI0026F1E85B|nr:Cache 3/Cache 2 fusion domain-containing protein [Azovibrio restrictus]MDD3481901.1 Cache 3/Cache 2 fusion domain-containing protein [Azovibrio restrictus]
MRNNQPVTGNEVILADDCIIVSRTDLKGQITYVNKAFLEVSGFAEEELLGQPHNVVRHPDMPSEAYADLWARLQTGEPWVGLVKNRCKNGDHYWVEAHVSPLWEGGQVVGYLSVRRKPERARVAAAEQAYRLFREGRAGKLGIAHGQVVSRGLLASLGRRFSQAGLSGKIILGSALGAFAVMAVMALLLGARMGDTLAGQGRAGLAQSLSLIKGMVEVRAGALAKESSRLNQLFAGMFPQGFELQTGDQPQLSHGGELLNGRYQEVDAFTASSGAVATIFALQDGDFLRISTSLKKETGERATGTLLGKGHPAHAKLLNGQPYVGKAKLFGKDYYTAYSPIKDAAGQVVGALFIGMDVSAELAELKQQIKQVKVGETGYFFVLDARPGDELGVALIHPAKEGQNLLAAKDADGREFIREMLSRKQGEMLYPWSNPELGDASLREKIALFDTVPEWNWLIGGGTYLDEFEAAARSLSAFLWGAAVAVVVFLVLIISWLVRRLITRPLQEQVLPAFRRLSAGQYDNPLEMGRADEIGLVLKGLEAMQNRLGFEVTETKRVADEMTRIKIALDSVSTGVMIADQQRRIIYTNASVERLLKNAEADIRQEIPDFDADHLLGASMDSFHKRPEHQARLLAGLQSTHTAQIEIGGRTLVVSANPVVNAQGERLGAVAEWQDRTLEVGMEREIQGIVYAAAQGDFSKRLALEGKEGFFHSLALGLNQLLDTASNGLQAVAGVLESLARGDLTRKIEGDYQGTFARLRDDANATVEQLTRVVRRIQESTEAINTAAQEIASGNTDLSSRTEEQASSLEETASSMEELTGTVKQNADNAREANQLADSAQVVAERGGQVVEQVVQTMGAIHQSSSKIADIIGVIDGIAFQTNILALNAAVEAARAGEQGRGFAVVATEVRNLAQRSAGAAKEIKGLISDSVEKVEAGSKLVDQAGRTMEEVVSSIKKVARIMGDIAEASREQSAGIDQVGLAVSQMDEMTQQNAALVEEAAAAAESLEEQARSLAQAVSVFRTGGHGGQGSPVPTELHARPALAAPAANPLHELGKMGGRKPALVPKGKAGEEWEEF